jgi:hypothetical protein
MMSCPDRKSCLSSLRGDTKSFHDLPDELSQYRNQKMKAVVDINAFALIQYLGNALEESNARRVYDNNIIVG